MQFAEREAEAAQYEAIMRRWRETGEVFTDHNFHPTKKLFEEDSVAKVLDKAQWERIDKKLKSKLFERIDEKSVVQGPLGDCYLLSSLSAMAQYPQNIKFLFHEDTDIASGAALVYFYVRGQRFPVLIDTIFPFKIGSRLPVFAHPRDVRDSYWFCLVEKAYAKLYGSYSEICGGQMHEVVYRVFGYSYFTLNMDEKTSAQQFFDKMIEWTNEGCIMGASIHRSKGKVTDRMIKESGLVSGHAYFVKCAEEHEGIRLVNLYNPWGDIEWQGDFGDASDLWRTQIREAFHFEGAEDGSFWMKCEDFYQFFTNFEVCVPVKRGWKCVNAILETRGMNPSDEIEIVTDEPSHFRVVVEQCEKIHSPFKLKVSTKHFILTNTYKAGTEIGCFSSKESFDKGPSDRWNIQVVPLEKGVDRMRMFLRFYVKDNAVAKKKSSATSLIESTGGTLPFGIRSMRSIGPPVPYRGDDDADRAGRQREEEERRRQREEEERRRKREEDERRDKPVPNPAAPAKPAAKRTRFVVRTTPC